MNNKNQQILNQNTEPPKNFWQRLKLWQKIGIIVLAVVNGVLFYYILIFPPTLFDSNIAEAPDAVFNVYLRAEENCDINLANSLITKKSKEIIHYTCSNMADERKCLLNRTYKVLVKDDTAIIHFDDFSHKTGWPFFFAEENGEWKIDFYKMAHGITMGGSGCDTGWGWRNDEIKNEFCSYFKEGECPEKTASDGGEIQKEISAVTNKTEYQVSEEVKLTITNNLGESIELYNVEVEKYDGEKWEQIRYDIECPCMAFCKKAVLILLANDNREFTWDQKETECRKVNEGTYRFRIAWESSETEEKRVQAVPKISYSNEFRIIEILTFPDNELSCNDGSDCIARFSSCDCKFHCINKLVIIKDCSNVCNILPEAPVCYCINNKCKDSATLYSESCEKLENAIALTQDYIRNNNIAVLDINNPYETIANDDYWYITFGIKPEPVVLPPYRTFNVEKKTCRIYEVPRE